MKKVIIHGLAVAACALTMASCTEEMEWNDSNVSAPSALYAPDNNKSITLQASATATSTFQWGSSSAEDGGAPQYEVLFDKQGGDFSSPLFSVASDRNGTANSVDVPHKILNKVAGLAGAAAGETATVQWTVVAYRGIKKAQSAEVRTVALTRFYGFDEVPAELYVINSAEEGGVAAAVLANGEYEVFVKLDKDKGFTLNSKADGTGTSYSISGTKIAEGTAGYNVAESGVYRIALDFNVASLVSINKVDKTFFYFCPNDVDLFELTYVGNGVFEGSSKIEWKQEGWGRDERYKFHMYYSDGTKVVWGTKIGTDGRPNGLPETDSYFFTAETPDNQWDEKWKLDTWTDTGIAGQEDVVTKISLIFNVSDYTHHVEKGN